MSTPENAEKEKVPKDSHGDSQGVPSVKRTPDDQHEEYAGPKKITRVGKTKKYLSSYLEFFDKISCTPITLYESDREFKFGKGIETNDLLLAYFIRKGILRIVNKFTADTMLFRGHSPGCTGTDCLFIADNVNKLVSVTDNGELMLTSVHFVTQEDRDVMEKYAIEYALKLPKGVYFKRVIADKRKQQCMYALTNTNEVFHIDFTKSKYEREEFAVPGKNEKTRPNIKWISCSPKDDGTLPNGIVKILDFGKYGLVANDMCQSTNGVRVAFGFTNGEMRVYRFDLKSGIHLLERKWKCYPMSKRHLETDDIAVYSIRFCENDNLIVGGDKNSIIGIWNIASPKEIELVETLEWEDNAKNDATGSDAMMNIELFQDSSAFIIAPMNAPRLCFVKLETSQTEIDGIERARFDELRVFNCTLPCITLCAILKLIQRVKMYGFFVVQTSKIQLMHLSSNQLSESYMQYMEEDLDLGEVIEGDDNDMKKILEPSKEKEETEDVKLEDLEKSLGVIDDEAGVKDEVVDPVIADEITPKDEESVTVKDEVPDIVKTAPKKKDEVVKRKMNVVSGGITREQEEQIENRLDQKLFLKVDELIRNLYNSFENDRIQRMTTEQQHQKELLKIVSKTIMEEIPQQVSNLVNTRIQQILPTVTEITIAQVNRKIAEKFKKFEIETRKSITENFQNLEKALKKGNQAMGNRVVQHIDQMQRKTETSLRAIKQEMKSEQALEKIVEKVTEKQMKVLVAQIGRQVGNIVQKEVRKINVAVQQQGGVVQQQQPFPEKEFKMMMQKLKYNEVLEKVLKFRDLGRVTWCLKQMDVEKIKRYSKKSIKVDQKVALGLLQQLSVNLNKETVLKMKWMNALTTIINVNDGSIATYVPKVFPDILVAVAEINEKNPSQDTFQCFHMLNSIIQTITNKK